MIVTSKKSLLDLSVINSKAMQCRIVTGSKKRMIFHVYFTDLRAQANCFVEKVHDLIRMIFIPRNTVGKYGRLLNSNDM